MSMKFLKTIAPAALSELWEKVSGNIVPKDTSASVGIGTDDPGATLEVSSATPIIRISDNNSTGTASTPYIEMGSDTGTWAVQSFIGNGSSGNSDVYIYNYEDAGIQFYTDGDFAAVIDNNGKVGIGNAIPGDFSAYANELVVGSGTGNQGMSIYSGTGSSAGIHFTDGTAGGAADASWVGYRHNTAEFTIGAEAADVLTILSGNVTVTSGNLVVGTAGKGIDFSNQASPAAGMTSELLDRYEEGTWVPTFTGVTSITYTAQTGFYTRVGDMVYVQFYFLGNWTASSTLVLNGLPFTVGLSSGATINIAYQSFEAVAPIGYCSSGGTTATFYEMGTTGTAWAAPSGTGKYLIGQGVYKTTT